MARVINNVLVYGRIKLYENGSFLGFCDNRIVGIYDFLKDRISDIQEIEMDETNVKIIRSKNTINLVKIPVTTVYVIVCDYDESTNVYKVVTNKTKAEILAKQLNDDLTDSNNSSYRVIEKELL